MLQQSLYLRLAFSATGSGFRDFSDFSYICQAFVTDASDDVAFRDAVAAADGLIVIPSNDIIAACLFTCGLQNRDRLQISDFLAFFHHVVVTVAVRCFAVEDDPLDAVILDEHFFVVPVDAVECFDALHPFSIHDVPC